MPGADTHIVLLVPGLHGPVTDHPTGDYIEQRPAALDRLLSRAQASAQPGDDPDSVLLHCFGLDVTTPLAPLTSLADTGHTPPGYVMRADPVHLRADQSSLRLFEAHSFTIDQAEADALTAAFNAFYAGQGWQLAAPVAERWYLHLDKPVDITTTAPWSVAGGDINPALPQGEDARIWHAMLNEVQMLFHAHEVNLVREQQGRPVINSLWPWGGGVMPGRVHAEFTRVLANDPLAQALACMAGIESAPLPADLSGVDVSGTTLVVEDALYWPARYNDIEQWLATLQRLEQTLFAPLAAALAAGRIDSLRLLPCNGTAYTLTRARLRRFWRRVRPFEQVPG